MAKPAFLSIVVTGRNDAYGRDFKARFFRTLRFNHDRLAEHDVSYEVVFVEWNPVPHRPLLAELLAAELTEPAKTVTASYVVDRRYHDALTLNPRLPFLRVCRKKRWHSASPRTLCPGN